VAREHNCIPDEFPIAWEFISHYSLKDGVRYYSPSCFVADDAVAITE